MYHDVVPAGGRSGAPWARRLSRSVAPALAAGVALTGSVVIAAAAPAGHVGHVHAANSVHAAAVHGGSAVAESHEDRNANGRGRRDHDDRSTSTPGAGAGHTAESGPAAGVLAANSPATAATAASAPAQGARRGAAHVVPRWPDVLLAPPATLPQPATIVPASTEGLGATPVLAAGAVAVLVLGTLLGVRIARRPT